MPAKKKQHEDTGADQKLTGNTECSVNEFAGADKYPKAAPVDWTATRLPLLLVTLIIRVESNLPGQGLGFPLNLGLPVSSRKPDSGKWRAFHLVILTKGASLKPFGMLEDMASAKRNKQEHATEVVHSGEGKELPNPVWFKPIMFGFMLLGLAWIITFYVSGGLLPVEGWASYNILTGFGLMFVGFMMTTRWR